MVEIGRKCGPPWMSQEQTIMMIAVWFLWLAYVVVTRSLP